MDTVIVTNNQFYSHYPKRIAKGTVNAEQVEIRLDKSWDGLTVRIHWLNVASNVEKKPLLERDQPNTIPWEVLTDLGELRMGLVGMDGDTVIKPTIWITYGYVSDGVDPEAGSDPQPPTPSWEQQMVEQATQANQAAQAAQQAAEAAAAVLPPLTEDVANKFLAADETGKKLIFIDMPGGGGGGLNWELVGRETLNGTEAAVKITADTNKYKALLLSAICGSETITGNSTVWLVSSAGNIRTQATTVQAGYQCLSQVFVQACGNMLTGTSMYTTRAGEFFRKVLESLEPAKIVKEYDVPILFGGVIISKSGGSTFEDGDTFVLYGGR